MRTQDYAKLTPEEMAEVSDLSRFKNVKVRNPLVFRRRRRPG
jgi:hypothetical protein